MDWLRRIGDLLGPDRESAEEAGPDERAAPGVAALFRERSEHESHAVLDLGPSSGSSLEVYRRFARHVRFADLLSERAEHGSAAALESLPGQPDRPYDMVFAWNAVDRLLPRERTRLVQRLAEISAPDAWLHMVTDAAERPARRPPLRFVLLDVDRVRCEPAGPPRTSRNRLLPADVEELLDPFRVVRAFTLKGGLREYVAARGDRGAP